MTIDKQVTKRAARSRSATRIADQASAGVKVLLVKMVALGIVDAIAVYALFVLVLSDEWLVAALVTVVTIVVNWIYFTRRALPAKYLAPGVIFLVVFQIFVVGYTAYIGFTNYSTGHNADKSQAIDALMSSALERVPDSPAYDVTVVEGLTGLGLLVTDPDGDVSVGTSDSPLQRVTDAQMESGKAVAVGGYSSLTTATAL